MTNPISYVYPAQIKYFIAHQHPDRAVNMCESSVDFRTDPSCSGCVMVHFARECFPDAMMVYAGLDESFIYFRDGSLFIQRLRPCEIDHIVPISCWSKVKTYGDLQQYMGLTCEYAQLN